METFFIRTSTAKEATLHYITSTLTTVADFYLEIFILKVENIIKMTIDAPQPEMQVERFIHIYLENLCSKLPSGIIVQLIEKVNL